MKWLQQATLIDWKKLSSNKNIHFYRQNYNHILCRLKKQVGLFLHAHIKVNCVPSCIQNCVTVSFVWCWLSAFPLLPFCFASCSHTVSYSFISLEGWTSFTFPSLFSYPYGSFFPLYFFSTLTLHIPFGLAFPSYQTVYELCRKHGCMKWFFVLPAAGRVLL